MKHDFDSQELELPAGWDPKDPLDPAMAEILWLVRDADRPRPLLPGRVQATQLAIRQQLLAEGLIRASTPPTESFTGWLRSLLLGGGVGGQVVRFGAVAAVAFVVGTSSQSDLPSGAAAPLTVASVPSAAAEAPASPATADQKSSSSASASAAGSQVAQANLPSGFAVQRSTTAQPDWNSTLPAAGPRAMFPQTRAESQMVPVAAAASTGQNHQLAAEALDQLQMLKFFSIVDQNEDQLNEIRRVEQTIAQMMGTQQEQQQERPTRVQALEMFRRAEHLAAAGRYSEAQASFEEASALAPSSSLGFLALFQAGRIALQHTQDYPFAIQAFRECLDKYPAQFISDEHQAYLRDNLSLLSLTSASNWDSLRAWQAARRSNSPLEAVRLYMGIVARSESPDLAADAATMLREILMQNLMVPEADVRTALQAMTQRAQAMALDSNAARIQLAFADVLSRRTNDVSLLLSEYQQVLALSPDEATEAVAQSRLHLLQPQQVQPVTQP
jgi:tetratricopeptide (TPR) repeat protein